MTLRQLPCGALLGLLLAAAGGAQGDSSLIIGTQLNPKDWDGMGMQVFFISSINGDAIPEIISSAHCTDVNGPLCGSISCYDGAADPVSGDHALIWRVDGDHARDQLGEIARNFGDADGDGFDDIMVAARLDDEIGPNAGSVRLLSGVDGQEILRVYPEPGEVWFGMGMAAPGDLSGDGVPDLVIGAPNPDGGSIALFSSAGGERLAYFRGPRGAHAGRALAPVPDIDGDGVAELLVGAPGFDAEAGAAWLLSGARLGQAGGGRRALLLRSWRHDVPGAHFGETVSAVGDRDGDGVADVAIGAPEEDTIFFYSGASGALLHRVTGHGAQGGNIDGVGKVPVAVAGDLNGDSYEDLLIGEPWYNEPGLWHVGRARLLSGYDWSLIREFQAYVDRGDLCGASFGTGGDLDGNGMPDLLIGIPGYGDRDTKTAYGAVLIETF